MRNIRKRLYIATIGKDAAELAAKYGLGLEVDEYSMAQNLEGAGFSRTNEEVLRKLQKTKTLFSGKNYETRAIFHAPFNELFPAAIDPKARQLARDRFEQTYKMAERYGVKQMVVHSGYVPQVYFKKWHEEQSAHFWQTFMADKPKDFTLYIENVLEDEPYMMVKMAEMIRDRRIKFCLDIGHANCVGKVPVIEWIEAMGPYLGHMHIHNNSEKYDDHNPLGKGTINMEEAFSQIERCCPKDMTMAIESVDCRGSLDWLVLRGMI